MLLNSFLCLSLIRPTAPFMSFANNISKKRSPSSLSRQSSLWQFAQPKKAKTSASGIDDDSSTSKWKVFCDLDGVLVDFDRGVQQVCGLSTQEGATDSIPSHILWPAIGKANKESNGNFFRQLEWTADGKELWEAIRPLRPNILTGCPNFRNVAEQKFDWCQRELVGTKVNFCNMKAPRKGHQLVQGTRRQGFCNVITCHSVNKHYESGNGCVLIDDRESLRKAWEDKGGIFVHHTSTRRTLELLRKKGILPEVVLDKEANCSDSKDDTLSATPEDQKSITTQVSSESKEKMKCSGSEQITCK